MMTRDTRRYFGLRIAFGLFAIVPLALSVLLVALAGAWIPYLFGQADCGCAVVSFRIPGGPVVLGLSLAVVALGLSWRWWRSMWLWSKTSRNQLQRVHQRGRWLCHVRTRTSYILIPDHLPNAHTIGWSATIVVSTGMLHRLSAAEFEAVLKHEAVHQRRNDPLWSALIYATGLMYGWPQWMREWAQTFYSQREITADAAATNYYRSTKSLTGAVLKLASPAQPAISVDFSPNHDRIEKLLDPTWSPRFRAFSFSSLLGLAFSVGILLAAGIGVGQSQAALPPYPAGQCPVEAQTRLCQNLKNTPPISLQCVRSNDWQCLQSVKQSPNPYVPITLH